MSKGILSKQIYDAVWSDFFNIFRFKAENDGRKPVEINPAFTSQTCLCRHIEKKSLSQRQIIV
jgi:transposase